MIRLKTGDIFNEDAEALVNAVNCVGVMGRGVALQLQTSVPRELQGVRSEVQARGNQAGASVRV